MSVTSSKQRKSLAPPSMGDRRQSLAVSDTSAGEVSMSGGSMSREVTRRMSRQELMNPLAYRRMTIRRGSGTSISSGTKFVKLENTYALGPKPNEKFDAGKVEKTAAGVLSSFLSGESYDRQRVAHLSQKLADMIKARVKEEHLFPRYKIVCFVVIAQNSGQGIQSSSRCIWTPETDTHAVASFTSKDLVATATIFGLYNE